MLDTVTVAGGITAFAQFFGAPVDPAAASLSDRYGSKSERHMPFLKFTTSPPAAVTVLVLRSPTNGTGWVNTASLFVIVVGHYTALTLYCMSYGALIAELSHGSKKQLIISTAISLT